MGPDERTLLRTLILGERLLALGVVVKGAPVVGVVPFAPAPDLGGVYVQASRLSRHGRGLLPGAAFSAVVHRPDRPDQDPLQVPRVAFEGTVNPLDSGQPELEGAIRAFVGRFPGAARTLALPDFTLHRLDIHGGRLVAGFGRAFNLSAAHFTDLARE